MASYGTRDEQSRMRLALPVHVWAMLAHGLEAESNEVEQLVDGGREVKGIGFDATCSLAVADQNGEPVVVTKGDKLGQNGDRNIILWADHRAEQEAELINSTGSTVLDYVGGTMSVRLVTFLFIGSCDVGLVSIMDRI